MKQKALSIRFFVKVLLKEYKHDGEIEFGPVYFNSLTKTIVNNRFKLKNAF